MLKRLRINNFQSHKDSDLKLHEGVNAIVGPSDCGKSAILRALRWVLFNDQPGEAYRRHGSKETSVTVELDGNTIERLRNNKDNSYEIEGVHRFDKVKNEVPDEIQEEVNMDDINVQRQMDAPFLLSENPPEVGRVLNRAAGIDDIDVCMTRINSMERENSAELKTRTNDLKDLDSELSRYRRLPDVDAQVRAAEELEKALRSTRTQADDIGKALSDLETLEVQIGRLEPLAGVSLDSIEALNDKYKNTELQYRVVRDTLDLLSEVNAEIGDLDTEDLERWIKDAMGTSARLGMGEKVVNSLEAILSDIEDADGDYKDKKEQHAKLKKEFEKLMPDTCPLCEQEVTG